MPNQTTNDKLYDCGSCVNKSSPLCELCTQITSPGGKERKPKYFIALAEVKSPITQIKFPHARGRETKRRAITIAKYLCDGLPIPIRVVMEYNVLTEREMKQEE